MIWKNITTKEVHALLKYDKLTSEKRIKYTEKCVVHYE